MVGKSILMKAMLEQALSDGRIVAVITPEGTTIHKRHKHLTSITQVKPAEQGGKQCTAVIYDEDIIK